ncbi:hypothetical protein AVEN_268101-1 [Araneus ventricosus]|uniref:Uncharacterized protein n=1 Tax=Araneus ventricosus TaxID=182803 RepID=A0A4Y2RYI4_ARAVE|nr:hypothetical protein AVEN_268101-1 [Araneus ventricosus]
MNLSVLNLKNISGRFNPSSRIQTPCGRGGLVVRSRLRGRRFPGSKSDSTEAPTSMGPVARYIIRSGQALSRWCGAEIWRGAACSGVVLII